MGGRLAIQREMQGKISKRFMCLLACLATEIGNLHMGLIFLFAFFYFTHRPSSSKIFPSRSNNNPTSYRTDFNQKYVGKTKPIRAGTSSGSRRNNPHPSEVLYGWFEEQILRQISPKG